MKFFINHVSLDEMKNQFKDCLDVDVSLFLDYVPKNSDEFSSVNFMILQEPNEYFGYHDWTISNKHLFSAILTWDDKILNTCENAMFLPMGATWMKPDQYCDDKIKNFDVSFLRGNLLKTYGHSLRHELYNRKNEIKNPIKFFDVYGERYDIEKARIGKEFVHGTSQFGVAIENTQHNGYFTEKILDCFLLKTIPIYWGCSNIEEFFDVRGMINFTSVDDIIKKINKLDGNFYLDRLEYINKNYELAKKYVSYEINIKSLVSNILKENGII